MAERRRVLFVGQDGDYLARHFSARLFAIAERYHLEIASPALSSVMPPAPGEILPDVPHHKIPMRRGGPHPADIRTIAALSGLFRRVQPDLVHLVTLKPIVYGGLALRLARGPALLANMVGLGIAFVEKNGVPAHPWLARMGGAGFRLALRRDRTRVIFENPDDADLFESRGYIRHGTARVIRGAGVDLDVFKPRTGAASEEALVILAARLLKSKGIFEFAQAARLVRERGVKARFMVVGTVDPDNPDSLTDQDVRNLEAGGDVEMRGWCDDMPGLLRRSQIACLPSTYPEGGQRFLQEAMACGLPVVTTDMPGCREAVVDGKTGFLVSPHDIQALANALEALLADPSRAAAMGMAGRARAEEIYSNERVIADMLAVYDELLESRRT